MRLPISVTLPAAAAFVALVGTLACSRSDRNDRDADTIAVPAAAVDTTQRSQPDSAGAAVTVGPPGAGTTETGRQAATGVDTPITKKLREEGKKP